MDLIVSVPEFTYLLCYVTMTSILKRKKNGNIFYLKEHICLMLKMNLDRFNTFCTRERETNSAIHNIRLMYPKKFTTDRKGDNQACIY